MTHPVAADDADLVLDVDFTLGEAAVDAILVTANGFTKTGTPTWSVDGITSDGTAWYKKADWTQRSGITGTDVTVIVQVKRADVAQDYVDGGANFIDSQNLTNRSPAATEKVFFHCDDGTNPWPFLEHRLSTAGNLTINDKDAANAQSGCALKLSEWKASDDSDFVTIAQVCSGLNVDTYLDGVWIFRKVRSSTSVSNVHFKRMAILANYNAGNPWKGTMKRLQIVNRAVTNTALASVRVAWMGDSYVQGASNRASAASATVANIYAAQNSVARNYISSTDGSAPTSTRMYPNPYILNMKRRAVMQYGTDVSVFNAGVNGKGWSTEIPTLIDQAYFDAVVQYDPAVLFVHGSVNDVNLAAAPTPATMLATLKTWLEYVATRSRELRAVYYVETAPCWKTSGTPTTYKAQQEAQRAVINPGIDGYALTTLDGRTVNVQLINLWDSLVTDGDYNGNLHSGATHEYAADYVSQTGGALGDLHPAGYGHIKFADVLWPYFRDAVLTAGRIAAPTRPAATRVAA